MRGATAGDLRGDAALPQQPAVLVVVVATVGEHLARPSFRSAPAAANGRDGVDQGEQLGDVVTVATGQDDGQGKPVGVGDQVVLAARPAPVDRAGTGEIPPLRARRCEESTTAWARSSSPAARSSARTASCSCCHTPASYHSFNLRQHVAPDAPNIAVGKSFQRMPVLMTNRIPSNAARLSARRRPGNRYRRSGTGINCSRRDHNASVTTRSTMRSSLSPTSNASPHTASVHSELTSKPHDPQAMAWAAMPYPAGALDAHVSTPTAFWPTKRTRRGRSAPGYANETSARPSRSLRTAGTSSAARPPRRLAAGFRPAALPPAQRRRTLHQSAQTMARPGHAHRRTRRTHQAALTVAGILLWTKPSPEDAFWLG